MLISVGVANRCLHLFTFGSGHAVPDARLDLDAVDLLIEGSE
jgi:hypothetical protein